MTPLDDDEDRPELVDELREVVYDPFDRDDDHEEVYP